MQKSSAKSQKNKIPARSEFEIRTDRLFLRPIDSSDAPEIFKIATEFPEITKFMIWNPPKKIEETEAFVERKKKEFPEKSVVWVIFFEEKFAGIVGLEGIERILNQKWRLDCVELGYWLAPPFHRHGIMTEAVREVCKFGFEKLKLHKIECTHIVENVASQKTMEKCGFRLVGIKKSHLFFHEKWWDLNLYELLATDFYRFSKK